MKEKIKIEETMRIVNGNLGNYDKKTRTFVGIKGSSMEQYVEKYLKDDLEETIFETGSRVEIKTLNKIEKAEFKHLVDRVWMLSDDDLMGHLRLKVWKGN